jgi:FtsH-binding integral membrane protein
VLLGLVIALFGLKMAFWWAYAICFGLSWAVLTTYWDFLFKYDNFYAHGLGCGLAGIPLIWVGVPLHYILIRIVICSVGMGLWSKWIGNDVSEEMGRGVLFII